MDKVLKHIMLGAIAGAVGAGVPHSLGASAQTVPQTTPSAATAESLEARNRPFASKRAWNAEAANVVPSFVLSPLANGPACPAWAVAMAASFQHNYRYFGEVQPLPGQSRAVLRRRALPTTLTEDSAMAAAAMIGERRIPKNG